jgi:archaellum biogenesis ATPase FlaH
MSTIPPELAALFPTVEHGPHLKPKRRQWTLQGTWLYGKVNFIAGPEKAGKSRLTQWLLAGLLTGGNNRLGIVAGQHVPKKWLYLTAEEDPGEVADRLRRYAAAMGTNADSLPISYHDAAQMQLHRYDVQQYLSEFMRLGGYDAVVIDPLRRVHQADENDNTAMASLMAAFRAWSKAGITCLITHHTGGTGEEFNPNRIANWLRGASDFAAALDAATLLWRTSMENGSVVLTRAGRFPPQPTLQLHDSGDPPRGKGWELMKVGP